MKVTGENAFAAVPVTVPDVPEAPAPQAEAAVPGRAIVPIKPIETERSLTLPSRRGSAPFLTQLIATERQLPQTRERRRAAPSEAIAAYGAVAARVRHATR